MFELLKHNQIVVAALTGSLATYLLGLVVTHLRREKKWLGFSVSSRNSVKKGHTHLSMKYDSRDIQRLDSHAVLLRNIGNRPLTHLPIHIESKGGEIVEHEFIKPYGMAIESGFNSDSQLIVTCDLINPGEAITLGLTVADSEDGAVQVVARAENLHLKQIAESVNTEELLGALVGYSNFARVTLEVLKVFSRRSGR